MKRLFLVLMLTVIGHVGFAKEIPELKSYLQNEILAQNSEMVMAQPQNEVDFQLRRFLLRLSAGIGIKVPWVTSFEVAPEVEFVFIKTEQQ